MRLQTLLGRTVQTKDSWTVHKTNYPSPSFEIIVMHAVIYWLLWCTVWIAVIYRLLWCTVWIAVIYRLLWCNGWIAVIYRLLWCNGWMSVIYRLLWFTGWIAVIYHLIHRLVLKAWFELYCDVSGLEEFTPFILSLNIF